MSPILLPFAEGLEPEPGRAIALAERLRGMSEQEFYTLCQQNRDQKFERHADGTIELLPLSGGLDGRRHADLLTQLNEWAEADGSGLTFGSSTGFRLLNGAVRAASAAWVPASAWQQLSATQRQSFPPLCPEFLVALLPHGEPIGSLLPKMQEFIDNGCRLAWLIDPKTETARIFRADGSVSVVKNFAESLSGEDVLPGFVFELSLLK